MEIDRISKISRIKLSDKEKKKLNAQLDDILKWAEKLPSKGNEEYFTEKTNAFREDKTETFKDADLIRKNFPKMSKGKVVVPRGL